jgi:hydroxyacylglutathione hydrolase
VFFTPCHTTGHVLYVASGDAEQPKALFSGDTLFIGTTHQQSEILTLAPSGGCGRFFEGSASQMYHNLIEVVATLPKDTQVYCGHEYTEQNLRFAQTVEPNNQAVKVRS